MSAWHDRVGDLTLFEALTGGAFNVKTGNIAGNLTKICQKSQMPGGLPGGGWAVLELTGTLGSISLYLAMLRMSNGVSNTFALCPMRRIFTGFDVAFLIVALVDFRKLAKGNKHSGRETVCKAKPFLWSIRSLPNDAMWNLLILLACTLISC